MHVRIRSTAMAILAATTVASAQDSASLAAASWEDPLDEDAPSGPVFRIGQSVSWSDAADPPWSHGTSASLSWAPPGRPWGVEDMRASLDLLGAGFQFDSLWGVQSGVGASWSAGPAWLDLDGWLLTDEDDPISDAGGSADLSVQPLESVPASIALFGSLSLESGSEAGAALRWFQSWDRLSVDADLSASRRWDVDASAVSGNLPKRLVPLDGRCDQWAASASSGIRLRAGGLSVRPGASASAVRSEIPVSKTTGSGKSKAATVKTAARWSLDATPSLRVSWTRGGFDASATFGETSAFALSSGTEADRFSPWMTFSVSQSL